MLVLSRKKGESIVIGGNIEIVVLETEGDTVKIGIQAPKHVDIYRKEVYLSIRMANREAAQADINLQHLSELFKKNDEKT